MGNISYLIPTVNKRDYNEEGIIRIIKEKFSHCDVYVLHNIIVEVGSGKERSRDIVFELWFENDCYLIDKLKEENVHHLTDNPERIKELMMNITEFHKAGHNSSMVTLAFTHRRGFDENGKGKLYKQITRFLHSHFKAFWLDEGINPEMIPPNYQFK